jgi:hypothetical protein
MPAVVADVRLIALTLAVETFSTRTASRDRYGAHPVPGPVTSTSQC